MEKKNKSNSKSKSKSKPRKYSPKRPVKSKTIQKCVTNNQIPKQSVSCEWIPRIARMKHFSIDIKDTEPDIIPFTISLPNLNVKSPKNSPYPFVKYAFSRSAKNADQKTSVQLFVKVKKDETPPLDKKSLSNCTNDIINIDMETDTKNNENNENKPVSIAIIDEDDNVGEHDTILDDDDDIIPNRIDDSNNNSNSSIVVDDFDGDNSSSSFSVSDNMVIDDFIVDDDNSKENDAYMEDVESDSSEDIRIITTRNSNSKKKSKSTPKLKPTKKSKRTSLEQTQKHTGRRTMNAKTRVRLTRSCTKKSNEILINSSESSSESYDFSAEESELSKETPVTPPSNIVDKTPPLIINLEEDDDNDNDINPRSIPNVYLNDLDLEFSNTTKYVNRQGDLTTFVIKKDRKVQPSEMIEIDLDEPQNITSQSNGGQKCTPNQQHSYYTRRKSYSPNNWSTLCI